MRHLIAILFVSACADYRIVNVDATARDPGGPAYGGTWGASSAAVCEELGKMECELECFPEGDWAEEWLACRLEFQVRCSPSRDGARNGSVLAPNRAGWEEVWSECQAAFEVQSCDDGLDLVVPNACRDLVYNAPAEGN